MEFQLDQLGKHAIELLESLLPSLRIKKKSAPFARLLIGGLLAVLVLPLIAMILVIFLSIRLQNRIASIESNLENFAAQSRTTPAVPSVAHARLLITDPPPGAVILDQNASITGVVDSNLAVIVSSGRRIISAVVARDGRFVIPALELARGANHFEVSAVDGSGNLVAFEKITMLRRSPETPLLAKDFSRGDRGLRQIALTFDGGSNDNSAEPILEILKLEKIKATIFLTGGFIRDFPELTREIAAQGHEVGNHSWSHPHLTSFAMNYQHRTLPQVSKEFIHEQLNKTASLFEQVTGRPMPKLWRAPYGEHNEEIRRWAAELGYRHIGWTHGRTVDESMDTMDWVADTSSSVYRSSGEILQRILRIAGRDGDAANGGIVLMHLGSERRGDEAYQMLPQLILGLREKDYEIVTVSELMN